MWNVNACEVSCGKEKSPLPQTSTGAQQKCEDQTCQALSLTTAEEAMKAAGTKGT